MAPVSKIVYPEGVLTPSSSSKNHNLQMKSLVQKKSSFNTTITTTEATQINQDLIKNYHLINFVVKIEQIPRIWINELLNDYKINEDQNYSNTNKIPSHRTRHSKLPKISRQLSRSPVLTRRPGKFYESDCDPSLQPIVLLSYETNEKLLLAHRNTLSDTNLFKRRCQRLLSTTVIQREYCTTYPANISRCVDCQLTNPSDSSVHSIGCRFQHCRILKYLNENRYEVEGFTSVDKATHDDTEVLVLPNSGEQPALNYTSANHTFIQIAKFFHLMCSYEETERKTYDEKKIIWKRYMAGWREVCDDCSTTLFNYHYMCQICGYMICIECFHEYSQMNIDKRKSKKTQRICMHENSFCLSEFIPWTILIELRNQCMAYFTKMKIDYSMKFNSSSRNDHLSKFIKTMKKNRIVEQHNVQQIWSTIDCNFDPNIEFYCHGRLPVFNEWISSVAKDFFQKVWSAGCPVLVRQVHRNLSKTLWQPRSFKLHMIDHRETPALWDCETLVPIPTNDIVLTQFWDGFECLDVRLKDGQRSRILKLKDWPTKKDFASVFPSRLHDLMSNIPFGDYTRRSYTYNGIRYHGGAYNIVERLPSCLVKPDLGPKLYIAYSQLTSQSCRQAGTTNLHIDVSDAVNVLVYVGIGGYGEHGKDKGEEIRQVEAEIAKSKIDQAQLQRLKNGERPGALWHLFRSDDASKIREYLGRTHRKIAGTDSIHDQTAYLEQDDLIQLKQQNNVESYAILQFQGDAIFIPSGAPHQVKNLHSCIKIAEDFVSPENLDRCLITTNEFRNLSKTHTNHADILQAKNILYYATRDALNSLINSQAQLD